jgi:hypothetical protein
METNTMRAIIASLVAGTAMTVAAPDTVDEERDNVIIVTAQKRSQNLQDVPIAITAIGSEKLDELQINALRDIAKFLPSVTGTESNIWLTREERVGRDYAAFGEPSFGVTDQLPLTGGAFHDFITRARVIGIKVGLDF